mgnify:CR=1 FL=1
MKLLRKITAIFDRIIDLAAILGAILIVFAMLAVNADIAWTFFRGGGIIWVYEIGTFCLLYITFLGTAWVLKKEGHVKMDFVFNRLKPRDQARLNVITSVFGIIISLVLVWWGVKVTCEHFQNGYYIRSIINYPTGVLLAIIPFGSFLLFIQFLRRTYGYIKKLAATPHKNQMNQ